MDKTTNWTADPTRGREFVQARADEVLDALRFAADVASAAIDENEASALKAVRDEAAQRRAKIAKVVHEMERAPASLVVRKYFAQDKVRFWRYI